MRKFGQYIFLANSVQAVFCDCAQCEFSALFILLFTCLNFFLFCYHCGERSQVANICNPKISFRLHLKLNTVCGSQRAFDNARSRNLVVFFDILSVKVTM